MHLMWSMLNTLQLIMFILKFNIIVPPNAYLFFKNVEDFLAMKTAFIDDMLTHLEQKIESAQDRSSKGLISRLGTYLIAAGVLTAAIMLVPLLMCLSSRISCI